MLPEYVREKLSYAILKLITEPGDARSRLKIAFVSHLQMFTEDDFIPKHKKKYIEIMMKVGVYEIRNDRVNEYELNAIPKAIDKAFRSMRNSTASRLNGYLWEIYQDMD